MVFQALVQDGEDETDAISGGDSAQFVGGQNDQPIGTGLDIDENVGSMRILPLFISTTGPVINMSTLKQFNRSRMKRTILVSRPRTMNIVTKIVATSTFWMVPILLSSVKLVEAKHCTETIFVWS